MLPGPTSEHATRHVTPPSWLYTRNVVDESTTPKTLRPEATKTESKPLRSVPIAVGRETAPTLAPRDAVGRRRNRAHVVGDGENLPSSGIHTTDQILLAGSVR